MVVTARTPLALFVGLLRRRTGTDLQHRRVQAGILEGSGRRDRRRSRRRRPREPALVKVRAEHPEVRWQIDHPALDRGADQPGVRRDLELRHRCVPARPNATRQRLSHFDTAFAIAGKQQLARAFRNRRAPSARIRSTSSSRSCRRDGTLAAADRALFLAVATVRAHRCRRVLHGSQSSRLLPQLRRSVPARATGNRDRSGACSPRSRTRNRSGTRRRPARPACAA